MGEGCGGGVGRGCYSGVFFLSLRCLLAFMGDFKIVSILAEILGEALTAIEHIYRLHAVPILRVSEHTPQTTSRISEKPPSPRRDSNLGIYFAAARVYGNTTIVLFFIKGAFIG